MTSPSSTSSESSQHNTSTSNPSSPSHLRNRNGLATSSPSIFVTGGFRDAANVSPTLSSFSSGSNALAVVGADGTSPGGYTHRIAIRVDHSTATCFDPADKELYELWAPKP
ncbi:hypothetical protein BGW80DRAFT_1455945 [Lactifluus volemus]|nr:hypothetical protein BGW80DRAFT_1455945 [Lactifluus volemus]